MHFQDWVVHGSKAVLVIDDGGDSSEACTLQTVGPHTLRAVKLPVPITICPASGVSAVCVVLPWICVSIGGSTGAAIVGVSMLEVIKNEQKKKHSANGPTPRPAASLHQHS